MPAEKDESDDEDDDADDADGRVLALEIGLGAFAHGGGDFLHAGRTGIGGKQAAGGENAVNDRQCTAEHDQPEGGAHGCSLCFSVSPRAGVKEAPSSRIPERWAGYAKMTA